MAITLYSSVKDLRTAQILSVGEIAEIKINFIKINERKDLDKNVTENLPHENCFPILNTNFGKIYGCMPIIKYLLNINNEKELCGSTYSDKLYINNYLFMCMDILEKVYYNFLSSYDFNYIEKELKNIKEFFTFLDKHLYIHTYIVGENITTVDINICCAIFFIIESKLCKINIHHYTNLNRWYNTIKHTGVGKVLTEQKPDVFDEEKLYSKRLDELVPKSAFDLDMWKREYSNSTDIKNTSMEYFWKNYDRENWCIYKIKYKKLEGECNVLITTINQLGGFIQRIHPSLRKHSFGVFVVVGAEKNYDIKGVIFFRGSKLPQLMKLHPSFEFFSKKKLDTEFQPDKNIITDYFCAGRSVVDTLKGVPIVEAKVWK